MLEWKRFEDHLFTDHFPILIEHATPNLQIATPRKWRLELANWPQYVNSLTPITLGDNINAPVDVLTNNILSAAESSIPLSGGMHSNKPLVPWWNNEVRNAIREKKKALNKFKRHPT